MNATQQLKKINKSREEEKATLEDINKKLDTILDIVDKLVLRVNIVEKPLGCVSMGVSTKKDGELYVPDVEIDGMEVKANTKDIGNDKDVTDNLDKLNKLGGNK